MGWQKLQQGCAALLTKAFHIFTTTLLSLLLPLSFLLLARLSCYNYLSSVIPDPTQTPSNSFLFYLFHCINPAILYVLVSFTSVATLIHALTGRIPLISELPGAIYRPHLYIAWILLCTLQICVRFGAAWSMVTGIDGSTFENFGKSFLLNKLVFVLGLHETMLRWCKMVVKPVVDDTFYGEATDERWPQRVAAAVSFGGLWWWRLRNEVESLVTVVESKTELLIGLGVADFVGWWLYYLTVTIGIVKIVKGLLGFGMISILGRAGKTASQNSGDIPGNEDKV